MATYDLREYRALPWFRILFWFRIGFGVFIAALLFLILFGIYHQIETDSFGPMRAVGAGFVFLILGLLLLLAALMGPPAARLQVDEVGIRFEYARGRADSRTWESPRMKIQGRFTRGADDIISGGRPVWSIYGRFGGFSETFVPASAFEEMRASAEAHGFVMTESIGHPGWTLFKLGRTT